MADKSNHQVNWKTALDIAATVAIMVACASLVWLVFLESKPVASPAARPAGRHDPPPPSEPISLEGASVKGDPNARVAMIEYSEFQCPYCGAFARDTLPTVLRNYVVGGKLLVAFRNLPMEQIHPFALGAAEAAECAGEQGRFWQMHDLLFADQHNLDRPSLLNRGKSAGLELPAFTECLGGRVRNKVEADASAARALGISGTPLFFIGSVQADHRVRVLKVIAGAQPLSQFTAALDSLVK